MSNRQMEEMKILARRVAQESTARERSRVLWILERLVQQCAKDIDSKVLSAQDLQMVHLRFNLTKTIVKAARVLIVSGVRPPEPVTTITKQPGPAPTEEGESA